MTPLARAFFEQAEHCTALGSAFMGRLLGLCAVHWPEHGAVARKALDWPGDLGPKAASLPLRIAGGLHALVLQNAAPGLAGVYPPKSVSDEALWAQIAQALWDHEDFLLDWLDNPPQTNEVRRAAALIPVAHMLGRRFGLPLRLSELGASGGLNLNFDRFHLAVAGQSFGPEDSAVALSPRWQGPCPDPTSLRVSARHGVDLNPLDPKDPRDALRLMAYLWPDQTDRLNRTRAAMEMPQAPVHRGDAIEWLRQRLAPVPGEVHLIYSTVAWQYFPSHAQAEGRALITAAGRRADASAPLAWLGMEADDCSEGAALTLRLWPGGDPRALARVDFHGRWLRWTGPTEL